MRLLSLLLFCLLCTSLSADSIPSSVKRPHRQVSKIVNALQKELNEHLQLQDLLVEYGSLQAYCIECPSDQESILQLVRSARKLVSIIDYLQLQDVFDESFYVELKIISGERVQKAR